MAGGRRMTVALWVVQGLLALVFLFSGASKLVMSIEEMTKDVALPGAFLRFIGVAEIAGGLGLVLPGAFVRFIGVVEVLGGLGLVLPGLLRIRPGLTPWAAAGLVIIMIGAVWITLAGGGDTAKMAVVPAVTGILAAFVAYGRWRLAPILPKS